MSLSVRDAGVTTFPLDGAVIAVDLDAVGFAGTDQPALRAAAADFVERIERVGADATFATQLPIARKER